MLKPKRILDNKRCPNCGKRIGWQKILFFDNAHTYHSWRCKRCNAGIGYNNRRINAKLFASFGILMVFMALVFLYWPIEGSSGGIVLMGLAVLAYVIVWATCAIELKDEDGRSA